MRQKWIVQGAFRLFSLSVQKIVSFSSDSAVISSSNRSCLTMPCCKVYKGASSSASLFLQFCSTLIGKEIIYIITLETQNVQLHLPPRPYLRPYSLLQRRHLHRIHLVPAHGRPKLRPTFHLLYQDGPQPRPRQSNESLSLLSMRTGVDGAREEEGYRYEAGRNAPG